MSFVIRTYRCDNGGEGDPHEFEIMLASGEQPKFCPQCGCEVGDIAPIPAKISIGGSPIARATDMTYRALERSSAARAAELDAPELKITNLSDNLREGDVAAKMPVNTVSQFSEEVKTKYGIDYMNWGGGMAGGRVAPNISGPSGGYVGPGHIALHAAQPGHAERVREIVEHPSAKPYVGRR